MAKMNRGKLDDTLATMFTHLEYKDSYLFYAHMIGMCSIKIDKDLPAPAGVSFNFDHYNLYINPDMFDNYNIGGRLAILKHEMLHILYNHMDRLDDREFKRWNYATDCALNQFIDENDLPKDAVTPKTIKEHMQLDVPLKENAETYYELLKDIMNNSDDGDTLGGGKGNGESGDGNGSGDVNSDSKPSKMGTHETWKESQGDKDLQKDITKRMIEHAQNETIKSRGTVPIECSDWLSLHTIKSELNWKKVLRGIVGNKRVGKRSTIMRQDRRFPKREDLRGKTKDRMFNLLVVWDVSGSMNDAAGIRTLGEVSHVCDVTKTEVDLIQIDTVAYKPEKLSRKTKSIGRKGYGGTTLSPALQMAKDHNIDYQAVVVLTDGGLCEQDVNVFAELGKKVIWLIEPNGYIMPSMNSGKMKAFKLSKVEK